MYEKNDGFLLIYKYINIKIKNKIIEIKCIVIKITYQFYIKILIQNFTFYIIIENYSV